MKQTKNSGIMNNEKDVKRICGDGLSVKMDSNDRILEIIGDGCKVTLATNCGSIRIVGDGCRLKIVYNTGDVEYTGDGGQVILGPKSSNENVKYIGDGGRIIFDSGIKKKTVAHEKNAGAKINIKDNKTSSKNGDNNCSMMDEKIDNILNKKRETWMAEDDNKKETARTRKSEKTTKAHIVTMMNCESQFVKKWFVNPGSIIKSFDGASFAKIVPKQSKMTKLNVVSKA